MKGNYAKKLKELEKEVSRLKTILCNAPGIAGTQLFENRPVLKFSMRVAVGLEF